jgi:hypothetical protein
MTVVTSRVSWRSKKSTRHDPAHHPARLGSQDFLPDAHQPTPHDHSPILRGPGEQPPQLPAHPALRHATGQCAAPGNSTTRAQPAPSIAGEHGAGIQAPWKRCGNRVETDAPRTTLSPHSKAARSSAAFQSRRAVTPQQGVGPPCQRCKWRAQSQICIKLLILGRRCTRRADRRILARQEQTNPSHDA